MKLAVLGSERVGRVIARDAERLSAEVLADAISTSPTAWSAGGAEHPVEVEGERIAIVVTRA